MKHGDALYGHWRDLSDCPAAIIERLKHYFLTYKDAPDSPVRRVEIAEVFGREEAHEMIARSQQDYRARFAGLYQLLNQAMKS